MRVPKEGAKAVRLLLNDLIQMIEEQRILTTQITKLVLDLSKLASVLRKHPVFSNRSRLLEFPSGRRRPPYIQ